MFLVLSRHPHPHPWTRAVVSDPENGDPPLGRSKSDWTILSLFNNRNSKEICIDRFLLSPSLSTLHVKHPSSDEKKKGLQQLTSHFIYGCVWVSCITFHVLLHHSWCVTRMFHFPPHYSLKSIANPFLDKGHSATAQILQQIYLSLTVGRKHEQHQDNKL